MPKRNGWRLAAALGLLIVLVGAALAAYDAIWPRQSGTNVLTSKSLVVDASNASQGYIMARGDAGNKRLKLRVTQGKYKLTYDLNTSGDYEVFPLQLGDGSYTVELFENVSGKKYSAEGKVSVNVKLDDPYAPFLGPNQYEILRFRRHCIRLLVKQFIVSRIFGKHLLKRVPPLHP